MRVNDGGFAAVRMCARPSPDAHMLLAGHTHGVQQPEHGVDGGKSVMRRGVVTDYEGGNPHSVLSVAVEDDKGQVEEGHAEILPPKEMVRAGWSKESVKPGDEVTLTGRPGKYAQHIMWLEYLVTQDGKKLGRK